jgi:sigma-B regulation protein RsbU (phosphoserine phosphatase)
MILAGTAAIFLLAFGGSYVYSRQLVLKSVEESARYLTQAAVNRIELVLKNVEKDPIFLASLLERKEMGRDELEGSIRWMLESNKDIYSSTVAFEPYAFEPGRQFYAPFFFREGDHLKRSDLGNWSYRYDRWDWYQIPRELREDVWSEPYYDEGGAGIIMSTFSVPFFRKEGDRRTFRGVVTADISLGWLMEIVSRLGITRSGYAFLLSRNGVFVSHPDRHLILRESIFSLAEEDGEPALRELGRSMTRGGTGFVRAPGRFARGNAWIYYAPLPSSGWSLGVVIPERELMAGINHLGLAVLAITTVGLFSLLVLVIGVSRSITRPLRDLAARTSEISRGNLETPLPPALTRDEVGELTTSFEEMRLALKDYIRNLRETTAAKERIESELKIARNIQMSFVPRRFEPLPGIGLDVRGYLEPAREVGGDLYSFFPVDGENFFFAVGDVSGKGIPAALFMAVTITLMKGIVSRSADPAQILGLLNAELCRENDSLMFVTLSCGILNVRTGELRYSNAGHNPPVLCPEGGQAGWLPVPEGLVLGVQEDAKYRTERIDLHPGDDIIFYTDGVTEAMDRDQRMFTDARLLAVVDGCPVRGPEEVVDGIVSSVHSFVGSEPRSDDITILVIRWTGPPVPAPGSPGDGIG